jgi:hypothetical protein
MEETAEKTTTPRKAKSVTRTKTEYWFVRVLVVCVPALATSYFSYRTAKVESEAKAVKVSEKVETKAEAGYDEMLSAVKHIDDELKEQRKDLYEMKGHIAALEALSVKHTLGSGAGAGTGQGFGSGAGGVRPGGVQASTKPVPMGMTIKKGRPVIVQNPAFYKAVDVKPPPEEGPLQVAGSLDEAAAERAP